MARIPTLREDDPDTPPEAREFLKRVEGGLGEVFNAVRLLGNHPRRLMPSSTSCDPCAIATA
jgi:hypothetical protein